MISDLIGNDSCLRINNMKPKKRKIKEQPAPKADKNLTFSYRDFDALKRYVTEQGYIVSRLRSGLSQKQQRQLVLSIKRARHLALLPFTQTL